MQCGECGGQTFSVKGLYRDAGGVHLFGGWQEILLKCTGCESVSRIAPHMTLEILPDGDGGSLVPQTPPIGLAYEG
jgi:hypothetical protein